MFWRLMWRVAALLWGRCTVYGCRVDERWQAMRYGHCAGVHAYVRCNECGTITEES